MSAQPDAERTYRAIGRFVFEFSQVEYTIRHYLASEIGLKEEYFTAVMESYDVALLCAVAKQVLITSRAEDESARIRKLLDELYVLNAERVRVAHGLWVPHREGGTVHHVSRSNLKPAWFAESGGGAQEEGRLGFKGKRHRTISAPHRSFCSLARTSASRSAIWRCWP